MRRYRMLFSAGYYNSIGKECLEAFGVTYPVSGRMNGVQFNAAFKMQFCSSVCTKTRYA